jgi:hypothetical protein
MSGTQTRAQKAREPRVEIEDEVEEVAEATIQQKSRIEEVVKETRAHIEQALEHSF